MVGESERLRWDESCLVSLLFLGYKSLILSVVFTQNLSSQLLRITYFAVCTSAQLQI